MESLELLHPQSSEPIASESVEWIWIYRLFAMHVSKVSGQAYLPSSANKYGKHQYESVEPSVDRTKD